jgi:hypothetical protein
VKTHSLLKYVHKIGGAFFPCLRGVREKKEYEIPMLWERIRGARADGEEWEGVVEVMAFIQSADQVDYVGRKKKAGK